MGLKLVRMSDNEPIGWQTATIREVVHFLDAIFYLGFLLPVLDARRQTLADKAMRTVVNSVRNS
jgi:serine/threonine-protein kinase